MNCKQGDLAIVIRGNCEGRIVECLRYEYADDCVSLFTGEEVPDGFAWFVKSAGSPVIDCDGDVFTEWYEDDCDLRPIRGTPETVDERKEVEA